MPKRKEGGIIGPTKKAALAAATKRTPAGAKTSAKAGTATRATKSTTRRRGKYNAAGERVDGHWFASAAEARRYEQLKILVTEGMIDNLELQKRLPCRVNNELICNYLADFAYDVIDDRGYPIRSVIEDVKGMITDVYRLKKKLVQAVHRIEIKEIPAREVPQWAGRIF
jgi:hypothetical protein